MTWPPHCLARPQRGAALLMAMLTVTLIATLAAAGLWRQWRGVEVESAERWRLQAEWLLTGALDWGRLILRQDARSGGPDDLSEPWAIPLAESRVSTFLSKDSSSNVAVGGDDVMDAFLTGGITDLQGRLNAFNLVENGEAVQAPYTAFTRLFSLLGLSQSELERCVQALRHSMPRTSAGTSTTPANTTASSVTPTGNGDDASYPIAPVRYDDLSRMGLSAITLARLRPYVTWLPAKTSVNLNTAPVEVLYATIDGIDQAGARKIALQRSTTPFPTLDKVRALLNTTSSSNDETEGPALSPQWHGVKSSYFLINGQVRIDNTTVGQQSLVFRNGLQVRTIDRQPLSNTNPDLTSSPLR